MTATSLRVLLFDWTAGGHHPVYLAKAARALSGEAEVVVAAPDGLVPGLTSLGIDARSLGQARPPLDMSRPAAEQHRELALREIDLLRATCEAVRSDHVVHMYADPILRRLVEAPPLPLPTTLCIFFPRAHYPSAFDASLSPWETARAHFLEHLVRRWRRRSDAHALFTMDPVAARRWAGRNGAPVYWFPEPPVEVPAQLDGGVARTGYLLYGTLARRKGLHLVASAIAEGVTPLKLVLAGEVEPGYERELDACVHKMVGAGAAVELYPGRLSEEDCLRLLHSAQGALVPYPRHYGFSRVLLEAATAGTPVLAHDFGLVGYLVRRHSLGVAVDCTDATRFRAVLLDLLQDADLSGRYRSGLSSFAAQYSESRFRRSLLAPFLREARP